MEKTRIYLNYLDKKERESMTNALAFLRTNDKESKEKFLEIADELYGKGRMYDFVTDNGHYPDCGWATDRLRDFVVIMRFKREHISEQGIEVLKHNDHDSFDWRFFYGIAFDSCEREVYAISYSNKCSPNWNHEYNAQFYQRLKDIDFPLLNSNGVIYSMDDSLHAAINDRLAATRPMFVENDEGVSMTVKDQHGNYCNITGNSIEGVFRDYADNYTGYRNYRRQMASEWEIVDDAARKRYEEWKQAAKGLKSDWDKFYGGGIVD